MFDFSNASKEMKDLYSSIEEARVNIISFLTKNYSDYAGIGRIFPGPPAEISWDGKMLKFTIHDYPPKTKFLNPSAYRKIKELWQGYIVQAYRNSGLDLKFKNAHCLIVIHSPLNRDWDVDNLLISIIINAIRYTCAIEDDSYQYLGYSVIGKKSKEQKTEIILCEAEDLTFLANQD